MRREILSLFPLPLSPFFSDASVHPQLLRLTNDNNRRVKGYAEKKIKIIFMTSKHTKNDTD